MPTCQCLPYFTTWTFSVLCNDQIDQNLQFYFREAYGLAYKEANLLHTSSHHKSISPSTLWVLSRRFSATAFLFSFNFESFSTTYNTLVWNACVLRHFKQHTPNTYLPHTMCLGEQVIQFTTNVSAFAFYPILFFSLLSAVKYLFKCSLLCSYFTTPSSRAWFYQNADKIQSKVAYNSWREWHSAKALSLRVPPARYLPSNLVHC